MKILGISFIVFGFFWTIAGFLAYASDIKLGIAVGGINMVGLGIVMVKLSDMTLTKFNFLLLSTKSGIHR